MEEDICILMIDDHPIAHSYDRDELMHVVEEMYCPGFWRDMWDDAFGGSGSMREEIGDWRKMVNDVHGGIVSFEDYPVDPQDGHAVLVEILTSPFYAYNYSDQARAEIETYCEEHGIEIEE